MKKLHPAEVAAHLTRLVEGHPDSEEFMKTAPHMVNAARRMRGHHFALSEHVKALCLALLSRQRPWPPIQNRMDELEEIFCHYEIEPLLASDPEEICRGILDLKCGNRMIRIQIESLKDNIHVLKRLDEEFESLDAFVTNKPPEEIASLLSLPESPYKLRQVGFALALEYLRNVGIIAPKPDVHLMRICGPERLGILSTNKPTPMAVKEFKQFAEAAQSDAMTLDLSFWLFGSQDFLGICTKTPKCHRCPFRSSCSFRKKKRK